MAYASDDDLTTRYAVTLAVDADVRALALADARAEIDDERFGDRAVRAHCLLAMHYLAEDGAIAGGGAAGQLVTSRRLGELAVTYGAAGSGSDGPHSSTAYGRQFDALASGVLHPIVVG